MIGKNCFASWLHDCGKITTPKYVVDKATKLETLQTESMKWTQFEVEKRGRNSLFEGNTGGRPRLVERSA